MDVFLGKNITSQIYYREQQLCLCAWEEEVPFLDFIVAGKKAFYRSRTQFMDLGAFDGEQTFSVVLLDKVVKA